MEEGKTGVLVIIGGGEVTIREEEGIGKTITNDTSS